ncbi:MAG TPA: 30S ribosomal protein S8 [Candidatus Paceibacterota bacterium]|nr:30S ribosomal protein S8 [Candidatus Paceibacterota bacterium]
MYYDLLAKIKNAGLVKKEGFTTSFSNFDFEVAKLLVARHYLKDAQKKTVGAKKFLEIKLNYKNGASTMENFKIISRPSRHMYVKREDVKRVRQGYGMGVISTNNGILSDGDAKKKKVGGEYLFQIW